MKYPRIYEKVNAMTWRLFVPGGWLVNVGSEDSTSICFFRDPNHDWTLEAADAEK